MLEKMISDAMKAHEETIARLAELPGLGVDSAQQIIAEIGPEAAAFPSAPQLASWVGVCPGRQESAGESSSNRSAKGNRSMPPPRSTCPRRSQEGGYPDADRFSAFVGPYGIQQSNLGHRAPPVPADLEVLARQCPVHRAWSCPNSNRLKAEAPTPRYAASQDGLSGRTYITDAQPVGVIFEGVAGVGG